jgi:hypothetical protein
MKLPEDLALEFPVLIGSTDWRRYEAIVRDCAKESRRFVKDIGFFDSTAKQVETAILRRYGLTEEKKS